MKINWLGVVLVALMAGNVQAQTSQPPPVIHSWTIGADVAPGGMVKLKGIGQSVGSIRSGQGEKSLDIPQTNDPFVGVHFGLKPSKGMGFEVRYMGFGGHGDSAGSVAQTDGTLMLWGANDTPHIVSTAPKLDGAVGYTLQSSVKFSRIDFLGNYNFTGPRGWLSAFGGVPILRIEATEGVTRSQGFLLYARLPNGTLDTRGIREDYAYSSSATSKARLFGLTGGVEGEYCLVSSLIVHGRVALAIFPWGSAEMAGRFTADKDIYLVNVSGGLTAAPTQTLAHLKLPGANYEASVKQTVKAFDGTIGLKWRIKGKSASLDIGGAITGLSLSNLPTGPSYAISDGFAPGNGKFAPRAGRISMMAPMMTIGVWF